MSEMGGVGCGAVVAGEGGLAMAGDGDGRMECGMAEREANADCSMSLPDRSEKHAAARKKLRKFHSRNAQKSLACTSRSEANTSIMKDAKENMDLETSSICCCLSTGTEFKTLANQSPVACVVCDGHYRWKRWRHVV